MVHYSEYLLTYLAILPFGTCLSVLNPFKLLGNYIPCSKYFCSFIIHGFMKRKILVPIAKGTEEMEFTIIVDMLRRAGAEVTVAGDKEIIVCSRGIKILTDILIDDLDFEEEWDAIIIPGGMGGTENLTANDHFVELLEKHVKQDKYYGAICAAPMIFSDHKLISDEAKITSHPSVKSKILKGQYIEDLSTVISGKLITSRGAGTAFDFSLSLIEQLYSKETADEIAAAIVYRR